MSGITGYAIRLSLDGGTLAGLLMDAHMKYLPCPSPSLIDGWPRCLGTVLHPLKECIVDINPSLMSGGPPTVYGLALMPGPHVSRHEHGSLFALWYWHHSFLATPHEREEGGGQWMSLKET